jgi:hypothetical protein
MAWMKVFCASLLRRVKLTRGRPLVVVSVAGFRM